MDENENMRNRRSRIVARNCHPLKKRFLVKEKRKAFST